MTAKNPTDYFKKYYVKNKDTLRSLRREPKECHLCDRIYTKGSIYAHRKTKKHKERMEQVEMIEENKYYSK